MGEVRKQELSTFYKRTETEIETEAGFAWGIEERGCFEGVGGAFFALTSTHVLGYKQTGQG